MGRTQERISRMQETYVSQANLSWMESLDRSVAQMKEYQASVNVPMSEAPADYVTVI